MEDWAGTLIEVHGGSPAGDGQGRLTNVELVANDRLQITYERAEENHLIREPHWSFERRAPVNPRTVQIEISVAKAIRDNEYYDCVQISSSAQDGPQHVTILTPQASNSFWTDDVWWAEREQASNADSSTPPSVA